MFNSLIKLFVILVLMLFEKKLSIASICVSQYHLTLLNFLKFLLFLLSNNLENSFIELKKDASIFAFSWPICLIPIE